MSKFRPFAAAIAAHFATMSSSELYRVAIDGDTLWQAYLAAFPEGTNPIYRVRTEHDGSYDRNVVRKLGNVVRINDDGTLTSIWDVVGLAYPYNEVAKTLSDLVRSAVVTNLFRIKEQKLGYIKSYERREDGSTIEWSHFHADIAARHQSRDVDTELGITNTTIQVMRRGFEEITPAAVDDVLELIRAGNLYRGSEFQSALQQFQRQQMRYLDVTDDQSRSITLWLGVRSPISRLRNTVIGTLLTDLSEGVDLERAVKSYEQKVAPTNYKRPTALITQGMINQAMETISGLGLEPALQRRFANLHDLSVNNVLWVDNRDRAKMQESIATLLQAEVRQRAPDFMAGELSVDDFVATILPKAVELEVMFTNQHQANLMSLTAPVDVHAPSLFKWGNNFAWSYNGNITDSIKEKVKAAGGNVNAALRVSLAWHNFDDLDLHTQCPDGHIYFGYKCGILDVDMNAGGGTTRTPVENLSWTNPKDGLYRITVDQYSRRETDNVGFTLEVANDGKVTQYSYPHAVTGTVPAITFTIKNQKIVELAVSDKRITGQGIAQQAWGLTTESFVKVTTVLNSPNHWDGEHTGNKHWFFILANCQNDEPARGIYNEFLKPELEAHRKVFEVLGNKTKCLPTADQLSGLGFSATKRDSVIVRVIDRSSTKIYKINF